MNYLSLSQFRIDKYDVEYEIFTASPRNSFPNSRRHPRQCASSAPQRTGCGVKTLCRARQAKQYFLPLPLSSSTLHSCSCMNGRYHYCCMAATGKASLSCSVACPFLVSLRGRSSHMGWGSHYQSERSLTN